MHQGFLSNGMRNPFLSLVTHSKLNSMPPHNAKLLKPVSYIYANSVASVCLTSTDSLKQATDGSPTRVKLGIRSISGMGFCRHARCLRDS